MGRPSKIDDVILLPDGKGGTVPRVRWEVIVERVRSGSYPEVAALSTGVDRATYYRWKEKGEDRWIEGRLVRADRRYRDFRDAIERAQAEAEAVAVAHIRKAGEDPKTWQAEAWYLERSRSERWRRRDTIHSAGPGDGDPAIPVRRVVHDLDASAADKLAELLGIVEGAVAPPDAGPGDEGAP